MAQDKKKLRCAYMICSVCFYFTYFIYIFILHIEITISIVPSVSLLPFVVQDRELCSLRDLDLKPGEAVQPVLICPGSPG